jgi:hypothetical protein
MPQAFNERPSSTQRNPYNRSQVKRLCAEANKQAARRSIKQQYAKSDARPKGLQPGALTPEAPAVRRGDYNPPGFFRRGGLSGVVYTNHIRCSYV